MGRGSGKQHSRQAERPVKLSRTKEKRRKEEGKKGREEDVNQGSTKLKSQLADAVAAKRARAVAAREVEPLRGDAPWTKDLQKWTIGSKVT